MGQRDLQQQNYPVYTQVDKLCFPTVPVFQSDESGSVCTHQDRRNVWIKVLVSLYQSPQIHVQIKICEYLQM